MSDREDGTVADRAATSATGQGDAHADRVVQMRDYEPCRPDRVLREMRDYWDSLRHNRAIPARSEVDPRAISRILDHAFILERIAPGAGRLRLAGRHLIDLMGMEVRGMPICAFLNTSSRGRLSDVLESVFKTPQIAQLTLESQAGYARPFLSGQMLLLPLRSDLGDVTRALGCLVADGEPGAAPRRFDLITDQIMPIIEGGTTIAPSPSVAGFSEGNAVFRPRGPALPEGGGFQPITHPPASPRGAAPPDPVADTPEGRRARFRVIDPKPGNGA